MVKKLMRLNSVMLNASNIIEHFHTITKIAVNELSYSTEGGGHTCTDVGVNMISAQAVQMYHLSLGERL